MAQQSEAGDVRHGMNRGVLRKLGPDPVQERRRGDHFRIAGCGKVALLQCRRIEPDTEAFRQDDLVARFHSCIATDSLRPAGADDGKAVDWFGRVYGVASRNRNAGGHAGRLSALQYHAHHLDGDLIEGHSEDGQRHDRFGTHGIDVGNCIGGRDPPEVVGVIDDRHEKICRRNYAKIVANLPYRSIVASFGAHQELSIWGCGGLPGQ
jgi:hypothetical protein